MNYCLKLIFLICLQLQIVSVRASCEKGAEQLAKVLRKEMEGSPSSSVTAEAKSAAVINDGMQGASVNAVGDVKAAVDAKAGLITDTEAIAITAQEVRVTNLSEGTEQLSVVSLDSRGVTASETNSKVRSLPKVEEFKAINAKSNLKFENRIFIGGIDDIPPGKKAVYFDVENSVLKQLNDEVLETKDLADATGNLFNKILYDKIQKHPQLSGKLEGRYRDFKSLRFRFLLEEGEDSADILKALKKLYLETTNEFEKVLSSTGMKPLYENRTGQLGDPKKWFLAGTGETPLEANMAARQARGMLRENGAQSKLVEYESRIDNLALDIKAVEKIRIDLQRSEGLFNAKIMVRVSDKKRVLSKDAISILRKTKPSDFKTNEEYHAALNNQFKKIFGTKVDSYTLDKMTTYFEGVDSLAPPLFVRNRVGIDLGQSENGLVSVDFTGIGVDNAYQSMIGLAKKGATSGSNDVMVGKALQAVDEHVEKVTDSMNAAKRAFNRGTQKVTQTRKPAVFSGDDGIYFPDGSWSLKDKEKLVRNLGRKDPSKYRVTFVETRYPDGTSIPVSSRSEYIVRAEKVEKEIRKMITGIGADKISPDDAKKLMIAIDFRPSQSSKGEWGVLLGGKASKEQVKLINLALEKVLGSL
jgi:hypothetical protein